MNTSGSPIVLGSSNENSNAIVSGGTLQPNPCTPQLDYTITKLGLNKDTLYIEQNPENRQEITIPYFEDFREDILQLSRDKVDTTFRLVFGDGFSTSGKDLSKGSLEISLLAGKDHFAVSSEGVYIKTFMESESGVVISPSNDKKTEAHYLTGKGTWKKVDELRFLGVITRSSGFPSPSTLTLGDVAIIEDLGDPNAVLTEPASGNKYKSNATLLYTSEGWVVIGYSSIQVNLNVAYSTDKITISNTAGGELTLSEATNTHAGVLSSKDKISIDTYTSIGDLAGLTLKEGGLSLNYKIKKLSDLSIINKELLIPLASSSSHGLLSLGDKNKIDTIPQILSVTGLEHTNSKLYLHNTNTDTTSGNTVIDKIEIPLASYTESNFKNGLISGEGIKVVDTIKLQPLVIPEFSTVLSGETLSIKFSSISPAEGNKVDTLLELPLASKTQSGLLSMEDKIKLDKIEVPITQVQSDFNTLDPNEASYIKHKPSVLTSAAMASSLVPSTIGVQNKGLKVLNANGEWINSPALPPITVSATEPVDPTLKVDGAIWIKTI